LTEADNRQIHTIYEPGSFIPLIRIEGEKQPPQTLAAKIGQYGNTELDENQTEVFNEIERQIKAGQLTPELEEHIYHTGNSPQIFKDLIDEQPPLKDRKIHYYQCDHLGTPIALISEQGEVDWLIMLDPWGNPIREYNPKNLYQPIRFQGQHFDEESGLHYNRFRYYDPVLGRYITQDPIGLKGGLNHFLYGSNPVKFIDPVGLDDLDGLGSEIAGYNFDGSSVAVEAHRQAMTGVQPSGVGNIGFIDRWRNSPRSDGQPLGYGCGDASTDNFVPDRPSGYNFLLGCRNHDICYGNKNGPSKAECDSRFLADMMDECENYMYTGSIAGELYTQCSTIAGLYYNGVKYGGKSAFENARK
jgi:RHS repeat-associated protein